LEDGIGQSGVAGGDATTLKFGVLGAHESHFSTDRRAQRLNVIHEYLAEEARPKTTYNPVFGKCSAPDDRGRQSAPAHRLA
jgi:hypothetical protein